jgi:predicted amidohydrolase YtcJ
MSDTKIIKANVITMDDTNPRVEAVAVTGKKIAAVGNFGDLQKQFPNAPLVDLGGKTLMPGFIDPHNHPLFSGVSLSQASSANVAVDVVYATKSLDCSLCWLSDFRSCKGLL